jgi:hypothetical protein
LNVQPFVAAKLFGNAMIKLKRGKLNWGLGFISLTKNKTFEYQFDRCHQYTYFRFDINFKRKTDHAGLSFEFSVFKLFTILLSIYDNRHWNYEKNCYAEPTDEREYLR